MGRFDRPWAIRSSVNLCPPRQDLSQPGLERPAALRLPRADDGRQFGRDVEAVLLDLDEQFACLAPLRGHDVADLAADLDLEPYQVAIAQPRRIQDSSARVSLIPVTDAFLVIIFNSCCVGPGYTSCAVAWSFNTCQDWTGVTSRIRRTRPGSSWPPRR